MNLLNETGEFVQNKGRFVFPKSIASYITLDETGKISFPFGHVLVANVSVSLFQSQITIRTR